MNEDEDKKLNEEEINTEDTSQDEWDDAFEESLGEGQSEEEEGGAEEDGGAADGDANTEEEDLSGDDEPAERDAPREQIREALDDVLPKQNDEAVQAVIKDIYPDEVPNPLVDADGDPIKSISDMLQLINPRTREPFTYDEARAWVDEKSVQYHAAVQERVAEAQRIVENNTAVSKGAEKVKEVYGKLLESMPEVAKQLVQTYQKTLEMTPSGNVKKAPVDILEFYNIAMQPYVDMAEKTEQYKDAAEQKVQAEAKQREKIKRTKTDRADITGGGNTDDRSESDKEWDAAFREVLGK